jgi:putative ABC transport system permease protein
MILIAVGIQRGIALDPTPIRISFGALVIAALWFLIFVAFCFAMVERRASIIERTQEFAVLRTLGASSTYLFALSAQETLLAVIPGTLIGITIMLCSKSLIEHLLPKYLFLANVYSWWPIGVLFVRGSDLVAALVTVRKIWKGDLLDAVSYDE